MWTLVIVLSVIFAVIGAFRWKRAMESPLTAMERKNRLIFAKENGLIASDKEIEEMETGSMSVLDDDMCTDLAYSNLGCNVYNDDLFKDDDPFGAGW